MDKPQAVPPPSRILGLTLFGDPFDRRSWSGSNWSLFTTLQRRGVLHSAHSVDMTFPQKVTCALRNFAFDRRQIYLDLMKSKHSFAARSHNAERVLDSASKDVDAILQVSALFRPRNGGGRLHCSYHDGNTAVSRRPEYAAFMSAASPKVMRESWAYEQEFYRHMDLVFTMSEWLRRSMIEDFGVPEDRVVAVGAGVNFQNEIQPAPYAGRGRHVLFVGTNFEFKGGPVLLEAFRQVRRELPDVRLSIVGCRPDLNEPGVSVIGVLDKTDPAQEEQLRRLYNEASLFVLPTFYDAFGIAYVEAMYHRVPCIGSNRCAVPEIIADGETGFLVDPTDAGDVAQKMLTLLRDERLAAEFGERGLRRAQQSFSWQRVVDTMLHHMRARLGSGQA